MNKFIWFVIAWTPLAIAIVMAFIAVRSTWND